MLPSVLRRSSLGMNKSSLLKYSVAVAGSWSLQLELQLHDLQLLEEVPIMNLAAAQRNTSIQEHLSSLVA